MHNTPGGAVLVAIGASFVNAQIRATIQPMTVQPTNKFNQKIARAFRLPQPMIDGTKYAQSPINRKTNTPDPSLPELAPALVRASG